jgi:beta-glucosidase
MTLSRRSLVAILFACSLFPGLVRAEDKPNDAVVPVPREGNWMKRHESFNERVKQGNVDLLLIGDSITQGWEGAGKHR